MGGRERGEPAAGAQCALQPLHEILAGGEIVHVAEYLARPEAPLQIGLGLFVTGMFAAIYHPVGLAIVTAKWRNTGMRIAVNGVDAPQKFDLADQILGNRYGYRRPAGGFLLWLDVSAHGSDEAVTLRLWKEAGLRVIPGSYLAREQADGTNPGAGYIRVAIVQDAQTTAEALHRLVAVLG